MSVSSGPKVLHYVGDEIESGDVLRCVRQLAAKDPMGAALGISRGVSRLDGGGVPTVAFAPMPKISGWLAWWRARGVAREAQRWLAGGPERIFHAHTGAGVVAACWLRRWGQSRVVASVHAYEKPKWLFRWAGRQLGDRIFWLSPAMKRYFGVKAPDEAWAQCIPPGVALRAAGVAGARRPIPAVVHVGGIGPLVASQCWHLMLDALAAMPAQQRWKIRFEHVGAPDDSTRSSRYQMALRTQTASLSLTNLVKWSGPEVTAEGLLSTIDVLVLPAVREPLSITALEALAAGVPVVAAGACGARDVIVPARNGWLIRSGDPRDLARLLVMLVESDALATVTPRPEPGWRFSAEVVAGQWDRVYARVLGRNTPPIEESGPDSAL